MRFPLLEQLDLPCVFAGLIPGAPHPDGRRYLPTIVLSPGRGAAATPAGLQLGVVDRHHRVAEGDLGLAGSAQLVCALSDLRLQQGPQRLGLLPREEGRGQVSLQPVILGRVIAVATWEVEAGRLPYETLYTELSLDIGHGVIGLRTSLTAPSLAETLGTGRLRPGDHVELRRSRLDILGFRPLSSAAPRGQAGLITE